MIITSDQLALEREMASLGVERYRAALGKMSTTAPGRHVLMESVQEIAEATKEWIEEALDKPSPRSNACQVLSQLDPTTIAAVAFQILLDGATEGIRRSTLICAIGIGLRDEALMQSLQDSHEPLFERLDRHKIPKHMRVSMANKWLKKGLWDYTKPVRADHAQAGLVAYGLVMEHSDIFREEVTYARNRSIVSVVVQPDFLEWVEECHDVHEGLSPVYLPMVQEPADWSPSEVGGYRSRLARRKPLCRVQRKSHIDELALADMPEVYRAVNLAQRTAWEVNPTVLDVAEELWLSNAQTAGMPNREEPEFPPKPEESTFTDEETFEEALKEWRQYRSDTLLAFRQGGSSRMRHARTLGLAKRFRGRALWMPQFLDFRSRMYPVPAWLNHQGPDLARGLLRFHRPSWVDHGSPEASEVMAYGEDLWGQPLEEGLVEDVHRDPLDCRAWEQAKKPWRFLAWCLDVAPWLEDEGVPLKVPLCSDGRNNGLQIYSLLMRSPDLARATNVSAGPITDVYQEVADAVWARVLADPSEEAKKWREFLPGLPRETVKRPVMAFPYGIRKHSVAGYIREWLLKYQEEVGARPWGRSTYKPSKYLANLVWDEVTKFVGPAQRCMNWLREVADAVKGPIRWTTPAGFPVRQDYPKFSRRRVRAVVADVPRYLTFKSGRPGTSGREQQDGLAPNFIHSLDASAMMLTINRMADEGCQDFAMVHDDYGCPAAFAVKRDRILREVFADIFSEDLLTSFTEEVRLYAPDAEIPDPPSMGDLDPRCVIDSEHFFG